MKTYRGWRRANGTAFVMIAIKGELRRLSLRLGQDHRGSRPADAARLACMTGRGYRNEHDTSHHQQLQPASNCDSQRAGGANFSDLLERPRASIASLPIRQSGRVTTGRIGAPRSRVEQRVVMRRYNPGRLLGVKAMPWFVFAGPPVTCGRFRKDNDQFLPAPVFRGITLSVNRPSPLGKSTSSIFAASSAIVKGFFTTRCSKGSSFVGPT
jgi:hypothetical protein